MPLTPCSRCCSPTALPLLSICGFVCCLRCRLLTSSNPHVPRAQDGGGYMDEEEAKTMVKGLRQAGLDAEREQRQREREARAARAKASKKALVAMAEMEPMPAELQPAVSATVPPVQKAKAEVSKAEDEGYEC